MWLYIERMPYKLRKAPKRNLYWVVGADGSKKSKDPIPLERAKAQMRALYAAESDELKGKGIGEGKIREAIPLSIMQQVVQSSYKVETKPLIGPYKLFHSTPTLKFYKRDDGSTILVGVRGTDVSDPVDLIADMYGIFGKLRDSLRYERDKKTMMDVRREYPSSSFRYIGIGHSLGGGLVDLMLRDGLIDEGISYNPLIEPQERKNPNPKHQRIYHKDDPLYKLFGRYVPRIDLRTSGNSFEAILTPISTALKRHSLKTFKGGNEPEPVETAETVQEVTIPTVEDAAKKDKFEGVSAATKEYLMEAALKKKGEKKTHQQELAQFYTPKALREMAWSSITVPLDAQVLEPSAGSGEWLGDMIDKGYTNITANDYDTTVYNKFYNDWVSKGITPSNQDYLTASFPQKFDLIIGNPPYFLMKGKAAPSAEIKEKFKSVLKGVPDIYGLFVVKGIEDLASNGVLSFVIPVSLLTSPAFQKMRDYIHQTTNIERITISDKLDWFANAKVEVMIFQIRKTTPTNAFISKVGKNIIFVPNKEGVDTSAYSGERLQDLVKIKIGSFDPSKIKGDDKAKLMSSTRTNDNLPIIYGENITNDGLVVSKKLKGTRGQYVLKTYLPKSQVVAPFIIMNRTIGKQKKITISYVAEGTFYPENHTIYMKGDEAKLKRAFEFLSNKDNQKAYTENVRGHIPTLTAEYLADIPIGSLVGSGYYTNAIKEMQIKLEEKINSNPRYSREDKDKYIKNLATLFSNAEKDLSKANRTPKIKAGTLLGFIIATIALGGLTGAFPIIGAPFLFLVGAAAIDSITSTLGDDARSSKKEEILYDLQRAVERQVGSQQETQQTRNIYDNFREEFKDIGRKREEIKPSASKSSVRDIFNKQKTYPVKKEEVRASEDRSSVRSVLPTLPRSNAAGAPIDEGLIRTVALDDDDFTDQFEEPTRSNASAVFAPRRERITFEPVQPRGVNTNPTVRAIVEAAERMSLQDALKPRQTGSGRKGNFKQQLRSVGINPAAYLAEARKKAKEKGYDPSSLNFSDDGVHKLRIHTAEGEMRQFGRVGYNDFLIYSHLEATNQVPKGTAEEKQSRFVKSHIKIKGQWKQDDYSPNWLSIRILW